MEKLYWRPTANEFMWVKERQPRPDEKWEICSLMPDTDISPDLDKGAVNDWLSVSKSIEGLTMGPSRWGRSPVLIGYSAPEVADEKPQMNLLIGKLLHGTVKVLMFGAQKYSPFGWMTVDDAKTRYYNSLRRHIDEMQMVDGHIDLNAVDKESGMPHLWHIQCNAYILEHHRQRQEIR